MPRGNRQSCAARAIVLVTIATPFLWCFGPTMWGDRSVAFRDAGNYFFPLFQWQQSEWASGRIPLWNPYDNCGMPVVGDATSSVFYPGKLLFALPMDFVLNYNLYVSLHVLFAAAATYTVARRFGAGQPAAGLAAVSYAFGGNVLFQCCNVVFLVSAAWLPLAFLAADRLVHTRSVGWAIGAGSVWALMVLGGDPQMAYHALLLTALYVWRHRRSGPHDTPGRTCGLVATAAVSALLLSAVQVLPAVAWTHVSERIGGDVPRNVYELAASLTSAHQADQDTNPAALSGILGEPTPGTHHAHAYDYSVGPWRFVELLWPNWYGRHVPENRRWISALPAEGRVWTPSMYAGLLPLLLGLSSWRLRSNCRRQVWLSWCVLLSGLASLGAFGLGWALQELSSDLLGVDPKVLWFGRPVGGLYWCLLTLLPGYVYFRYPAKLLVIFALGISLLAARGWDRVGRGSSSPAALKLLPCLCVLSLAAALLAICGRSTWTNWLADAPVDGIFGPLDRAGAFSDLLGGLLQTSMVAFASWLVLTCLIPRWPRAENLLLLLTAIDVAAANSWMTLTVPARILRRPPAVARMIRAQTPAGTPPTRAFRAAAWSWIPPDWAQATSAQRLQQVVSWEYDTLLPKHHLRVEQPLVESAATLRPRELAALLQVARQDGPLRSDGRRQPRRQILDALSTEYLIVPADSDLPAKQLAIERGPGNVKLYRSSTSFPRAWLVHDVQILPELRARHSKSLVHRARQIFGTATQPRDLRHSVVIETDQSPTAAAKITAANGQPESCRVINYGPQRVTVHCVLDTAGCLVMNDTYDADWQVQVDGASLPGTIWRANRIMRGVLLPAGEHQVTFRYRPRWFYLGAICSGAAWLALLGGAAVVLVRKRQIAASPAAQPR